MVLRSLPRPSERWPRFRRMPPSALADRGDGRERAMFQGGLTATDLWPGMGP